MIYPSPAGNAWMRTQHCGYWCANALGHQYPKRWLNVHCIELIPHRNVTIIASNIKEIWHIVKKWPSCLRVRNTFLLIIWSWGNVQNGRRDLATFRDTSWDNTLDHSEPIPLVISMKRIAYKSKRLRINPLVMKSLSITKLLSGLPLVMAFLFSDISLSPGAPFTDMFNFNPSMNE